MTFHMLKELFQSCGTHEECRDLWNNNYKTIDQLEPPKQNELRVLRDRFCRGEQK